MGSITYQIAQTGQPTLSKTYTIADSDVDKIVAAYQQDANVSVNGTATRAQVLNYVCQQQAQAIQQYVQAHNTVPASVPAPIPIT